MELTSLAEKMNNKLHMLRHFSIYRFLHEVGFFFFFFFSFFLFFFFFCLFSNFIQFNLSTTATLGTEESGRCGEVAVMGR